MTEAGRGRKPDWYADLKRSPYPEGGMSEKMKRHVTERLNAGGAVRRGRKGLSAGAAVSLAGILLLLAIAWSMDWPDMYGVGNRSARGGDSLTDTSDIEKRNGNERNIRNLYTEHNVKIMEAFPGGDYVAGTPAGCMWMLYAPFEQLKDRNIRIEGVHRETGYKLTELAETKISAAGTAYKQNAGPGVSAVEMTRIATRFAVPLDGVWSFIVYVDGERYADVVFDVADAPWEVSPTFKSGAYDLRGVKDRLGFIDPGFIAGKPNKYMWHFWGRAEELNGELKIDAVRRGSNRVESVFEAARLGAALNGADAAIPTSMTLPDPGMWRLMAFVDGKLLGSVVVDVKAAASR
ncbi:DUF4871 domain-containing protein [Paenibacillus mesophilus]|uniref:DUF4871 domain-containing protein n=1 Tax=Paenibacillus mesophilus TaxID=2582849 RepID=UPI00110DE3B7|nr:DUF4871 domain-containing protein [Paenibacillus mesophilus]TMV50848.1 DUF4871 domain-containing protein [Paenibacillus mesophilus]